MEIAARLSNASKEYKTGDTTVVALHVNKLSKNELAALRLSQIGFVFQGFNLLAPLSSFARTVFALEYLKFHSATA